MCNDDTEEIQKIICLCPLEGIIDIVSKKWCLLIINEIGNHTKIGYNELKKELGVISPKTLADMLKELQKHDLINRVVFQETPLRVEYTLTEDGVKLREAIIPLLKWAISKKGTVFAHCSCSKIEQGKRFNSNIMD